MLVTQFSIAHLISIRDRDVDSPVGYLVQLAYDSRGRRDKKKGGYVEMYSIKIAAQEEEKKASKEITAIREKHIAEVGSM